MAALLIVPLVLLVAVIASGPDRPSSATVSATPADSTPAQLHYVSTSGSDDNPGTSSAPWRTLARAARLAQAGSTVVVRAGTYAEDLTVSRSGTKSRPITFRADSGSAVSVRSLTFAASHVVFSGFAISGAPRDCVTLRPALTRITVSDGRITGCGRDGIRFQRPTTQTYTRHVKIKNMAISGVGRSTTTANNLTIYGDNVSVVDSDLTGTPNDAINAWGHGIAIRRNLIHDISNSNGNHNDALQTWTGMNDGAEGKPVTNLVFARNIVRDVTGRHAHAIIAEGPGHRNWKVYGNLVQNIGDQAFAFGIGSEFGIANVKVYNNTFVSAGARNTIEFNGSTSGRLANNIFYNCVGWDGSVPYSIDSTASVTRDHNLAGGTTKRLRERGSVNADPAFVNPARDFRLRASSPAIDAGANGLARSTDLDGKRPDGIVDIGAYEH